MDTARLLLIEDDDVIGRALARTLEGQGYRVDWAQTVAGARGVIAADHQLVLLDLGLPDGDGLALCAEFRRTHPDVDILILTARREEVDVVLGLEAGADDYIVKPFRLAELLARIKARLRRQVVGDDLVHVGPLAVDESSRRAWLAGTELVLRPKEFDLLALLVSEAGHVVSRERIMSEVWDENWFGSTKTLDIHMSGLRRKIDSGEQAGRITTLRGVGYRLEST